jgi:cleavage and polyadenylation specificity factor subunit 1
VAASSLQARFASYDEDGSIIWEPDGLCPGLVPEVFLSDKHSGNGISFPYADCSTLELISPEHWVTMDGCVCSCSQLAAVLRYFASYEFASNESVNALTCVSLETTSTESGSKSFIAVGTTINRGEDLAVKGAVCFAATMLFSQFIHETRHTFSRLSKLFPTLIGHQKDGTN